MRFQTSRAAAYGTAAFLALMMALSAWQYSDAGVAHVPGHGDGQASVQPPAPAMVASGEKKVKFYRNPMGLPDTSPVPKKDSMGMDYIPVYEGEHDDGNAVSLSPGKIQRSGVETAVVGRHAITRTIKAPGVVQLDERRIMVVAPRFDGYVEKVGAATSGSHIKKGDELATVFGQELLNQSARLLVEQHTGSRGNETDTLLASKDELGGLVGAHRRLRNLGVPEDFIAQVKRERRVPDTLTIRSPIDGVVLERNIVDGQGFKAGEVAFRLADHSVVWMMADVAESDMDLVKAGQSVIVTTRAHPGRTFPGEVSLVYPHLMKETRTVRVRIELKNPDLALLPDM